jgi:hypothetical protein
MEKRNSLFPAVVKQSKMTVSVANFGLAVEEQMTGYVAFISAH